MTFHQKHNSNEHGQLYLATARTKFFALKQGKSVILLWGILFPSLDKIMYRGNMQYAVQIIPLK